MTYSDYSDYEQEENDGNSEKRLDTQQDINTIKSVMSLLKMITGEKDNSGQDIKLNCRKVADGQTTNLRVEISSLGRMTLLESIDSPDYGNFNIVSLPTEKNKETEPFAQWSINTEE